MLVYGPVLFLSSHQQLCDYTSTFGQHECFQVGNFTSLCRLQKSLDSSSSAVLNCFLWVPHCYVSIILNCCSNLQNSNSFKKNLTFDSGKFEIDTTYSHRMARAPFQWMDADSHITTHVVSDSEILLSVLCFLLYSRSCCPLGQVTLGKDILISMRLLFGYIKDIYVLYIELPKQSPYYWMIQTSLKLTSNSRDLFMKSQRNPLPRTFCVSVCCGFFYWLKRV